MPLLFEDSTRFAVQLGFFLTATCSNLAVCSMIWEVALGRAIPKTGDFFLHDLWATSNMKAIRLKCVVRGGSSA